MSNQLATRILNSQASLLLPLPEDLSDNYNLNPSDQLKISKIISVFQESIDARSKEESVTKLNQAYSILGSFKTFSSPKNLTFTRLLKEWEVDDYDSYFDVKREQTKESPAFLVLRSILVAYRTFLNLRSLNQVQGSEFIDNSLLTWKRYHWLFFIFLQGNILCMLHFKKQNMVEAEVILKAMSQLMLASGASMLFAGESKPQEYENTIRPTMMPPHVKSPEFSGIMSYDHAYLINLWNQEKNYFKLIPSFFESTYEDFLKAHEFLALAHKFVCHKYGGSQTGSLRGKKVTALENLEKINSARRRLIIRSKQELLDPNSNLTLTDEAIYENYIKLGFKSYIQLLIKTLNL